MATSNIVAGPFTVGDRKVTIFEFNFDSSYPTGGESLALSDIGFSHSVDYVDFEDAAGYSFEFDHANLKVLARYFDYDAGADGPAIQVPNTTNLATVSAVRGIAWGR
jgi:hypothetical protein